MTASLTAAPESNGVSPAERTVPTAFSRPLSFRVRIVAEPRAFRRVPAQPAPALTPPAVRVRALDTSLAVAVKAASRIPEGSNAACTAAAVQANQAANVAFFLSRRPTMPEAKHHGKFRA